MHRNTLDITKERIFSAGWIGFIIMRSLSHLHLVWFLLVLARRHKRADLTSTLEPTQLHTHLVRILLNLVKLLLLHSFCYLLVEKVRVVTVEVVLDGDMVVLIVNG